MEPAFLWMAGTVMGEVGAHNIFHGTRITVVRWHVYGRGRNPQDISYVWSGAVMGEVGPREIVHGASTTVVG